MFSKYFAEQQKKILKTKKPTAKDAKKLKSFKTFVSFLKEHLPYDYNLATGKVRNKSQIISKSCDLIIFRRWCDAYLQLSGGYVMAEDISAFLSLDHEFSDTSLRYHVGLTSAIKLLRTSSESNAVLIPLYSIYFANASKASLPEIKDKLLNICENKDIAIGQRLDILCVLNRGILVRDWDKGGDYRGLLTEKDTLMWFYILFLEHIDTNNKMSVNLRNLVKSNKEYDQC